MLLTMWHIFATFLWVAPVNELRKAVPASALRTYMLPMFGQSWSVFAPKPIDGDYHISVRAQVDNGDGLITTEWVDSVNREMDMIHHNLFPPRAAVAGNQLASDYRGAWRKLDDEQQKIVKLSYFKGDDWDSRLAAELKARSMNDSAKARNSTANFIENEKIASAYATQVARALWGENVKNVQFKVARQGIVPFAQRNKEDAKRPAASVIDSGWRGTTVADGQSDENFAKIFLSLEGVK
ncbi:hypothetical protein CQ015_15910 [Arthrobacter sp. MYb221]|uniref:DUF5819 family protein n=1 Tax=Micrococcaceae TaxID=1268 RepID=UPI000CFB646D|nr:MULTISPECIES: DUF5819 family protein [unclassified Arthrobacter]PRA10081.1 hypothetical protein CQ015_15910 [Arthrobacter sp. MYb221]